MQINKKNKIRNIAASAAGPVIIIMFIAMMCINLENVGEASGDEGREILQDSINRAVICCYAVEGAYPESIDYLIENYGVIVDETKYVVDYQVFADNIKPDVTVLAL